MHDFVEAGVLVHLEAIGEELETKELVGVTACAMLIDSTLQPGVGDHWSELVEKLVILMKTSAKDLSKIHLVRPAHCQL